MSDLSGAAAVVLAFALVYLGLSSVRRWPIYCAADRSWPVLMYTATVVVHVTIVVRHGFVSGQRFVGQVAYALLSCPCRVRGSRRAHISFLTQWSSGIH